MRARGFDSGGCGNEELWEKAPGAPKSEPKAIMIRNLAYTAHLAVEELIGECKPLGAQFQVR
jgi:hypothetical protein